MSVADLHGDYERAVDILDTSFTYTQIITIENLTLMLSLSGMYTHVARGMGCGRCESVTLIWAKPTTRARTSE